MLRLILTLMGTLVLGGLGAIYIWTTINRLVLGEAGWERGLLAIAALVMLAALLFNLMRVVRNLEEPR